MDATQMKTLNLDHAEMLIVSHTPKHKVEFLGPVEVGQQGCWAVRLLVNDNAVMDVSLAHFLNAIVKAINAIPLESSTPELKVLRTKAAATEISPMLLRQMLGK